jgi:hypothetical protein
MKEKEMTFNALAEDEIALNLVKTKDYQSKNDVNANFNLVASMLSLYPDMDWATPEGVAIIYSLKQMDAAIGLLERGEEGGVETVFTRARDVSVYWKIIQVLHWNRKKKK